MRRLARHNLRRDADCVTASPRLFSNRAPTTTVPLTRLHCRAPDAMLGNLSDFVIGSLSMRTNSVQVVKNLGRALTVKLWEGSTVDFSPLSPLCVQRFVPPQETCDADERCDAGNGWKQAMCQTRIAPRAAACAAARPGGLLLFSGMDEGTFPAQGTTVRSDALTRPGTLTWRTTVCGRRMGYDARLRRVIWDPRVPWREVELGVTRDSTQRGVGVWRSASALHASARLTSCGHCHKVWKDGLFYYFIIFIFLTAVCK